MSKFGEKHAETQQPTIPTTDEKKQKVKKRGPTEKQLKHQQKQMKDLLGEILNDDGLDISLQTWHEWQLNGQFNKIRKELEAKYTAPNAEEDPDYPDYIPLDMKQADPAEKRRFYDSLFKVHGILEKTLTMQEQLTQHEKHCVRFYWLLAHHWTTEWKNKKDKAKWMKLAATDLDIYEIVESYFRIMRKYNLPTWEKPYYFLPQERKRKVLFEADMLKRTSEHLQDDAEIHISLLEDLK